MPEDKCLFSRTILAGGDNESQDLEVLNHFENMIAETIHCLPEPPDLTSRVLMGIRQGIAQKEAYLKEITIVFLGLLTTGLGIIYFLISRQFYGQNGLLIVAKAFFGMIDLFKAVGLTLRAIQALTIPAYSLFPAMVLFVIFIVLGVWNKRSVDHV